MEVYRDSLNPCNNNVYWSALHMARHRPSQHSRLNCTDFLDTFINYWTRSVKHGWFYICLVWFFFRFKVNPLIAKRSSISIILLFKNHRYGYHSLRRPRLVDTKFRMLIPNVPSVSSITMKHHALCYLVLMTLNQPQSFVTQLLTLKPPKFKESLKSEPFFAFKINSRQKR